MRIGPYRGLTPVVALSIAVAACSGSGLGDILAGTMGGGADQGQGGTVTVEVRQVDERQQQILVLTQDGQEGPILYDANTQVVYNNEQYPVRALERGDVVDMRVQQVRSGYYTDLIQVRTPVQDRQGGYRGSPEPDVYRVEGTVGQVNTQTWMFTLNMTQGGTVSVHLPSNAPAAARDRVQQLVPGDYVRVEVRPLDQTRAELVRFGWS